MNYLRKIHSVLINPYHNISNVYLSSDSVCLWDCNVRAKNVSSDMLKFVAGFPSSSFGQMMSEAGCQDMEGLGKIEKESHRKNISSNTGIGCMHN